MLERKVLVKEHIEQVRDGYEYKGYLEVAKARFDYEVKLSTPVTEIDNAPPSGDINDTRRLFQLTVKRGSSIVELGDEEYCFFFQILSRLVVDFYNDKIVRDMNNEGMPGLPTRDKWPHTGLVIFSPILAARENTYDFPGELCEALGAPKFGCVLA
ncbi:MAG TPA: hypothetical protein VJJ73_02020 [Candidatus Paceibacterota bacterium]